MFLTIRSLFRKSMVFKLRMTNSIIILTAYIAVAVIVSFVYHSIMVMREKQVMEVYLKNTLNSVDNKIKDFSRVSLVAFSDDITLDILQNIDNYTLNQRLSSLEYLRSLYTKLISIRNDIMGVYLFNENQLIFSQNTTNHVVKTNYPMESYIEDLRNMEAQSRYGEANHRMMITTQPAFLLEKAVEDQFDDPYEYHCIAILREIKTFYPNQRIGHILLIAPVSVLRDTLSEFREAHFSCLLLDKDGTVVFSKSITELGNVSAINENEFTGYLTETSGIAAGIWEGKKSIIGWMKSTYSGIVLLTATPVFYINRNTLIFISIISAIFAGAIVFVLLLTGRFTKSIINPIHYLSEAMANFSRENIQEELQISSEDEVGQLTDTFNTMKKTINELIFTEYENNIKLKTLQLQQKEAQLKTLQGQINPHFLYNTLDNIRVKAALNGDSDVSEMIMLLVDFFRGNLTASSGFVPISREIQLIKVYLALMQYRYPNLSSEFHIDNELLSIEIPSFILQPIVENSLVHGLKSNNYNGKIIISLSRDEIDNEFVLIKISDNGTGFSDTSRKSVNRLLHTMETEVSGDDDHVGVANVDQRLKLFFSMDCGLFFEDNPSGGVTAIIRIKEQAHNLYLDHLKTSTVLPDTVIKTKQEDKHVKN